MRNLEVISPPSAAVASGDAFFADLKTYLGIGDSTADDDLLLSRLIPGVIAKAEAYMDRAIITRTLRLALDTPGASGLLSAQYRSTDKETWTLPMGPVQSVSSVVAIDGDNAESTLASTAYFVDGDTIYVTGTMPARRAKASTKITYICGFGDALTDAPDAVRLGIMKAVASVFDNPADYVIGTIVAKLPDDSLSYFDTEREVLV